MNTQNEMKKVQKNFISYTQGHRSIDEYQDLEIETENIEEIIKRFENGEKLLELIPELKSQISNKLISSIKFKTQTNIKYQCETFQGKRSQIGKIFIPEYKTITRDEINWKINPKLDIKKNNSQYHGVISENQQHTEKEKLIEKIEFKIDISNYDRENLENTLLTFPQTDLFLKNSELEPFKKSKYKLLKQNQLPSYKPKTNTHGIMYKISQIIKKKRMEESTYIKQRTRIN